LKYGNIQPRTVFRMLVPLAGLEDRIVYADIRGTKFVPESGVLREGRRGQRQRGLAARLVFCLRRRRGDWGFLQKCGEAHPGETPELAAWAELEGVAATKWSCLSSANVKASLLPVSFDVPGLHRFINQERP
jgi:hypothetical protein